MSLALAGCSSRSGDAGLTLPDAEQLQTTLQSQLALMLDAYAPVGGQAIPDTTVVTAYEARDYRPLWIDQDAVLPATFRLLDILNEAHTHGLNPTHYHTAALDRYLALPRPSTQQLAELDVLATMALQRYAHDISSGRYDPSTIDSNWQLDIPNDEWQAVLALPTAADMVDALPGLAPQHPHYVNLQRWYSYYRELDRTASDRFVPRGELLMRGSREPRVAQLRARLQQLGDLRSGSRGTNPNLFDAELEDAVKQFQARHQLSADGRAGSQTLAAMNVPVAERAKQIRYNLERWRWLPAELEDDRIWVDLTGYRVEMHLGDDIHSMRAIIGDTDHMTRVFRGDMTYMEINPTWRVPQRIARELILPQVQRDPDYLSRNDYQVFSGWHNGAEELDPDSIDWSEIEPEDLYYRFEQLPNPGNAMGQYKFMFPNRNAIYLHDTPQQRHFGNRLRAESAGCVRLANPSFFAERLLTHDGQTLNTLNQARASEATTVVSLNESLPIYLAYFTVTLNANGLPEFRNDVYQRDPLMAQAMDLNLDHF